MNKQLSIIIPYHNEELSKVQKLFIMLDSQVNVIWDEVEIIISNNCDNPENYKLNIESYENIKDIVKFVYPDVKNNIGISRQCGVDNANGRYLMFIDSDDILYAVNTIQEVLGVIYQVDSNIVMLQQLIETTVVLPDGTIRYMALPSDQVFGFQRMMHIHDKLFKREFIQENGIRFCDKISYNEDGYYNVVTALLTTDIVECDLITYVVKYNKQSVSKKPGGQFQTYVGEQSVLAFYYALKFIYDKTKVIGNNFMFELYRDVYNSFRIVTTNYKDTELYKDSIKYTNAITAKLILEFDQNLTYLHSNTLTQALSQVENQQQFYQYVNQIISNYNESDFNEAIVRSRNILNRG